MKDFLAMFDSSFGEWIQSACKEWNYPSPSADFYSNVEARLPDGLRAMLGLGLKKRIILASGHTFTLQGLPSYKGPYNWFSRYTTAQTPSPNWEYYIQVAEFVRLSNALDGKGYTLTFEDNLMDIGIYKKDRLLVFLEAKEKASQVPGLLQGIKRYEEHLDLLERDRGKDPLRKAKYIVQHKPEYFCIFAIGVRREFRIDYPDDKAFKLYEDMIPLV